jgi:hypothetical protein
VDGKKEKEYIDEELSEREDLSNLNSEDLEVDSDDEKNPHGFVYAHNLDTFKKAKRERI